MSGLSADLVIKGGTIITVNPENDVAEAVAVFNGRIVAVGTDQEIDSCIGNRTEVINLNGQTVLPGFIEPHNHFMNYGIRLTWVDGRTPPNRNILQLQERLRKKAAETPKGEWIIGWGINEDALEEKRWPTRDELDAAASDNPVYIRGLTGHGIVVNSRALTLAGIDESRPQPEGGHMDKDPATGRLTGVMREKAAFKSLKSLLPAPTIAQMKEGLSKVGRLYAAAGITSIHDAGQDYDQPDTYHAYQEAIQEGMLKTRAYLMIHDYPYTRYCLSRDLGLRTGFGNERLRIGPLKTCTDGALFVSTVAFYDPYINLTSDHTRRNPRGLLQVSQGELNDVVAEAHQKGYQVAIHAQGDYGVDVAINAIQYATWRHPRRNARHRIEHCSFVTPEGISRMKQLGIIASFFPHIIWYWGDWYANDTIGKERASRLGPAASAIRAGLVTVFHSDAPIAGMGDPNFPGDPLFGIWCMANRKTRGGMELGPQERITAMDGIRAYTINGAFASFEENLKGSIEPGKLADLVILSDNPCTVNPQEIRNIKVLRTIIGGETVFQGG